MNIGGSSSPGLGGILRSSRVSRHQAMPTVLITIRLQVVIKMFVRFIGFLFSFPLYTPGVRGGFVNRHARWCLYQSFRINKLPGMLRFVHVSRGFSMARQVRHEGFTEE